MAEIPSENDINFYAETNFRGQRKRFGIKRGDRRKHVYIIGKTGMGKSTVLENMTIQDIQSGRGVAVVDPHGEYAEKMLDFIPPERVDDVIYFNPADTDFPLAFNIMEKVNEDQRHLVSSGLLGVFKKIFGPDVWSARMEYLLANAILALLEIPGATLLSVNRMFGEKEFRKRIVSELTDPVIRGFWENEFAKYPEQYMREAVAAIQNKIGQFSGNPLIRNVIGQPETSFDIRRVMDEEKILIINLAKGRVGEENSRLLGAMMVTKLYLTAMSRVDIPEPDRKDFYLYVDEFQNFATESFANILSEARKYRLNLTVAHQYVFQMEEMVQHAIFGNVGTMIVFRVGGEDAELLEKEFMPEFTQQDLVNLGFKQIYTKLMIDGITSRPFSADTLAPFPRPAESSRDRIIQASRERYGTPRAVVEERIRRFTLGSSAVTAPAGGPMPAAATGPGQVSTASDGGGARPAGGVARPERQMYEAVCAVDGKKIMVPFKPDGSRPVYCEEHMDMIKFRSKAGAGGAGKPAPERTGSPAGDFRRSAPPPRQPGPTGQPQPRPMPLNALRQGSGGQNTPRPSGGQPERRPAEPEKKEAQLSELRKVLEETMHPPAGQTGPGGPPVSPEPPAPPPSNQNEPRALAPGETIRFE
ncbi:MAG: type IV secretion system DNA-binding domain-containing protein [bacterium]|nr:type IV secretion system DNA-binding domain-containing protein [bacterium]